MASLGGGSPSEDKITNNKRTLTYPSGVVAMQSMLIPGGPYDSGVLFLFEHVDVRLALLLGPLLLVEVDTGGVEVQIRGDDRISLVDEEEGHVPS